jgi:signal transduction histidine kinase
LTGKGDYETDLQAMRSGASEYLEKGDLNPTLLERSIRYAVERFRSLQALRESEHKLRMLSEQLVNAQEDERKIVAREIHDGLGSTLTAIRYALEQKGNKPGQNLDSGTIPLEQIIEMVRQAIGESQRISSSLRPSVLDDLGLIPALRSLSREWGKIYGNIHIDKQLEAREEEIPESLKIVIYRIAQESLNNISKHSGSEKVLLRLARTGEGIELMIQDDGDGFDPSHVVSSHGRGGMGLAGMRERVNLSGGIFEIGSEKGKGTVVCAHWPL